jgi:hypothetical protein
VIAFHVVLAASLALFLGAVAFLILIVIGIRKRDRGDLASPPRDRLDAITRRVTGLGTRRGEASEGSVKCARLTTATTSCP